MLVLSRHRDESIMIGDDVVITIVDIRGDKVRLGIEAPQDIPVHRQEVYEAIKRENQRLVTSSPMKRVHWAPRPLIPRSWSTSVEPYRRGGLYLSPPRLFLLVRLQASASGFRLQASGFRGRGRLLNPAAGLTFLILHFRLPIVCKP